MTPGPLHPFARVGAAIVVLRTRPIRVHRFAPNGRKVELPLPPEVAAEIEREGALRVAYDQLRSVYPAAEAVRLALVNVDGIVTPEQEAAIVALTLT